MLNRRVIQWYRATPRNPTRAAWQLVALNSLCRHSRKPPGGKRTKRPYLYNNVSTKNKLAYESQLFSNYPISQYYSGQTATQLGVLYGNPVNGPVTQLSLATLLEPYPFFPTIPTNTTFAGMTTYNAMNLRLQKRYSHGFDFIVAYTVSKQMDNWSVGGAGVGVVDPIHFHPVRALSEGEAANWRVPSVVRSLFKTRITGAPVAAIADDDIPQQFNIAATYELPIS